MRILKPLYVVDLGKPQLKVTMVNEEGEEWLVASVLAVSLSALQKIKAKVPH